MSVAASLLPGVHVIVLDEPSTGMDVVSQRALWNAIHIQRNKSGRMVLLTTHSMEEAEAVCSRIAILIKGNLECYGSVQHLRDKYSDGHLVTFFVGASAFNDNLVSTIAFSLTKSGACERAEHTLDAHSLTTVQVTYKVTGVPSLANLFDTLNAIRESNQPAIENYSVTQASFESVFVQMVQNLDVPEN